jgi:hypothetical protein
MDALRKQLAALERRLVDASKAPPKPKGGKGKAASDTAAAVAAVTALPPHASLRWQVRRERERERERKRPAAWGRPHRNRR